MALPRRSGESVGHQRRVGAQRPLLLTGLVVFTIGVMTLGAGRVHAALPVSTDVVQLISEAILAIIAIAVLTRMHWWRAVGFRGLATLRDLRFFWIPIFPLLPALPATVSALSAQMVTGELERLGIWVAVAALVGFGEEVAFRGLILRDLARVGVRRAGIVSAVLFGAMHAVNPLFGADLGSTLIQVGYATAMGFAFAAVALRTGPIWPLIVIRALIDVVGFVAADATTATGMAGADVLVAARLRRDVHRLRRARPAHRADDSGSLCGDRSRARSARAPCVGGEVRPHSVVMAEDSMGPVVSAGRTAGRTLAAACDGRSLPPRA